MLFQSLFKNSLSPEDWEKIQLTKLKLLIMTTKNKIKVSMPEAEYKIRIRDRERLLKIKELQQKQNKILEQIKDIKRSET